MKEQAAIQQAFSIFSSYPLIAGYSDKIHNLRFTDDLPRPSKDREKFAALLGYDAARLICLDQVHSANIVLADEGMKGMGAFDRLGSAGQADALITRTVDLPLGIMTADCGSVFFYDPEHHTAGLAHVGWRGLYAGLPEKMVLALRQNFLSKPENLKVALGPMIRRWSYEVGPEMKEYFPDFIFEKEGKLYLDIALGITRQLQAAGVLSANIEDAGFCTYQEEERFFSYRREGKKTGRILSVIMLKPL